MKTVKRMLSLLCAAAITFSMSTTMAFASNSNVQSRESVYTTEELAQIELERQELTEFLKAQLIAQNALYRLDEFMFLVDMTIQQRYYPSVTARATSYYAPAGGFLNGTATNAIIAAEFGDAEITEELYEARDSTEDALYDVLDNGSSFIIEFFESNLNGYELAYSIAKLCKVLADKNMWKQFNIGEDGIVIYASYDTLNLSTTTVFWPWSDWPWIYSSKYNMDTYEFTYK